jgi:hypothetical protein
MLKRRLHTALGLSGSLTSHYDEELAIFLTWKHIVRRLLRRTMDVVLQVGLC